MKSIELKSFIEEIKFKNRNPRDNSVLSLLKCKSTNPEIIIDTDALLFRSRIVQDKSRLDKKKGFYGYKAKVSVATITVQEKMTLLDFTMQKIPKNMSDDKKRLFIDLSELFSTPVANEDDVLEYIPTQYIAEMYTKLQETICHVNKWTKMH